MVMGLEKEKSAGQVSHTKKYYREV